MRSFFYIGLLGVVLITISIVVRSGWLARKNPGLPINSAMRQALSPPEFTPEEVAEIESKFGKTEQSASGLRWIAKAPGKGILPQRGQTVSVHYTGRLLDGMVFDSSHQRGRPLEFIVGYGHVIKGWDEALLTMRKGEKRLLIVPYWLGYGESGREKIPARATLIFDVELLNIR